MRLKDIIPLLSGTQYKWAQVLTDYKAEQYIDGYQQKTEKYVSGYGTKTITEVSGEDPEYYNRYTNNKIGKTTNKYATAESRTNQNATGSTCKLINDTYIEANDAYMDAYNACIMSSSAVSTLVNWIRTYGSSSFYSAIMDFHSLYGYSTEGSKEIIDPKRYQYKCGIYNPKCTGQTTITRQVTDYDKPVYGTRVVNDLSRPIYKTRQVPVYEWKWIEE